MVPSHGQRTHQLSHEENKSSMVHGAGIYSNNYQYLPAFGWILGYVMGSIPAEAYGIVRQSWDPQFSMHQCHRPQGRQPVLHVDPLSARENAWGFRVSQFSHAQASGDDFNMFQLMCFQTSDRCSPQKWGGWSDDPKIGGIIL